MFELDWPRSVENQVGDNVKHDYRGRLVAKELELDQRLDLFAATAPLEAKNIIFSAAVPRESFTKSKSGLQV